MPLNIINTSKTKISKNSFVYLMKIARDVLRLKMDILVHLIFTDDDEIKNLNKQYRKQDAITDVLSFPYNKDNFIGSDGCLGEIVISVDQIKRQAFENGIFFEDELNKIFVHGLLHIFGYTHNTEKENAVMKKIESKIISSFENNKKTVYKNNSFLKKTKK